MSVLGVRLLLIMTFVNIQVAYVSAALSDKPEALPGSKYIYSGGGIIAASMAERITGKSWEELIGENVFQKLGMTTVGFGPMAIPPDKINAPWFHQVRDGKITPLPPEAGQEILCRNPVGTSVYCSVIDLGRFAAFHLSGLRKTSHSSSLLRPQTFRELYTVVKTKKDKGGLYTTGGWRVQPVSWANGNLVYWHSGQSKGRGYAIVHIVPELNYATCVMTNIGGDNAEKAANEITLLLADQLHNSEYNAHHLFIENVPKELAD